MVSSHIYFPSTITVDSVNHTYTGTLSSSTYSGYKLAANNNKIVSSGNHTLTGYTGNNITLGITGNTVNVTNSKTSTNRTTELQNFIKNNSTIEYFIFFPEKYDYIMVYPGGFGADYYITDIHTPITIRKISSGTTVKIIARPKSYDFATSSYKYGTPIYSGMNIAVSTTDGTTIKGILYHAKRTDHSLQFTDGSNLNDVFITMYKNTSFK